MRPYSKGQKNDFRDAEAIAEAVQRPTMKFVATKSADQLDLQALHRVRERVLDQPAGRIERRGLDERIVGAPVQRDDGRGMSVRDLTHLYVAGGARRPEQERRGVQAVDAGLNVADVPAFLGLASQRNELQPRIVHRCQTAGAS